MLEEQHPDCVIICTIDSIHCDYISCAKIRSFDLSVYRGKYNGLVAKKKPTLAGRRVSLSTHGSVHALAHLFDVLNGGNGLPLGISGAAGEPAPFPSHVLPHDLAMGSGNGVTGNGVSVEWR